MHLDEFPELEPTVRALDAVQRKIQQARSQCPCFCHSWPRDEWPYPDCPVCECQTLMPDDNPYLKIRGAHKKDLHE